MGQASPLYEDVRTAGRLVFVSGQTPISEGGGVPRTMTAQAWLVLEKVRLVLESVDATFADVVKMTYFLTDVTLLDDFRRVLAEVLPHPRPAASLVVVSALVDPRFLVEVEAVAER